MRDWTNALRPASFRGVPFWVDSDGPDVGRRVVVHEISGGERMVSEDMGRRATSIYVAAYVVGDASDFAGLALEAACKMPEASALILPMDLPQAVHCVSCRRSRYKDRMGYVAYDLEFVEAGTFGGFSLGGLGALREVFSSGLAAAASALF